MRQIPLVGPQLTGTDIFERMTETEIMELFDRDGDVVTVKPWIKEGIKWQVGDVAVTQEHRGERRASYVVEFYLEQPSCAGNRLAQHREMKCRALSESRFSR